MPARRTAVLWNVERLFGPGGSSLAALDATSRQGWTAAAYRRKLETVGGVLRACCPLNPPALLALVEVENRKVGLVSMLAVRLGP